jgi:nicotinamidase-related amidase
VLKLHYAGDRISFFSKDSVHPTQTGEVMQIIDWGPELPLPPHYDLERVSAVWRVPYETRAGEAGRWALKHGIKPASNDQFRIHLVAIDIQNTFCIPDFELFVAGRSGTGAIEDNQRLCEFIYQNISRITQITLTQDTHQAYQVFHANFLVNPEGQHPGPYTTVTAEDIQHGRWAFNPAIANSLGIDPSYGNRLLAHYTAQLKESGKFALTIWPYHSMLGGIGHALVSAVEEAIFFHTIARESQPRFILKGMNALTEHYSALGPEVRHGPDGEIIGEKNGALFEAVRAYDAVIIAGQAQSHCVAWTIADLLHDIQQTDPSLAKKVYLLEDCTSPVVVPGADFTTTADNAFARFSAAGMHRVQTTDPITTWPGIQ